MRIRLPLIALLVAGCTGLLAQSAARPRRPGDPATILAGASRLLVVTTGGWDTVPGTLRRFDRTSAGWQERGKAVAIVVGTNGMAWDRRLPADVRGAGGPIKREGDGRSPAGVFRLREFFGYAAQLPGFSRYIPLTTTTECVDDPASGVYGQVLERTSVPRVDWNSSEHMRRDDDLYRLGVIVDYDVTDVIRGAGSCIFLHIWRGPDQGTAGCTAMAPGDIESIVEWIGDKTAAALVQLPRSEYARLATAWHLP